MERFLTTSSILTRARSLAETAAFFPDGQMWMAPWENTPDGLGYVVYSATNIDFAKSTATVQVLQGDTADSSMAYDNGLGMYFLDHYAISKYNIFNNVWEWPFSPSQNFSVGSQTHVFNGIAVNFLTTEPGAFPLPIGVNASTGAVVWNNTSSMDLPLYSDTASYNGMLYYTSSKHRLIGRLLTTGDVAIVVDLAAFAPKDFPASRWGSVNPVAADEVGIVLHVSFFGSGGGGFFMGFSLSGEYAWHTRTNVTFGGRVAHGSMVFGSEETSGVLVAYSRQNGTELWHSAPNASSSFLLPIPGMDVVLTASIWAQSTVLAYSIS